MTTNRLMMWWIRIEIIWQYNLFRFVLIKITTMSQYWSTIYHCSSDHYPLILLPEYLLKPLYKQIISCLVKLSWNIVTKGKLLFDFSWYVTFIALFSLIQKIIFKKVDFSSFGDFQKVDLLFLELSLEQFSHITSYSAIFWKYLSYFFNVTQFFANC